MFTRGFPDCGSWNTADNNTSQEYGVIESVKAAKAFLMLVRDLI